MPGLEPGLQGFAPDLLDRRVDPRITPGDGDDITLHNDSKSACEPL